jgi:hypothetical protein
MQVIIDLHNYGRYNFNWQKDGNVGPGSANSSLLGTSSLPIAAFANFWLLLATALKDHVGIAAYDLMNEPYNLPTASTWPTAAQSAVNAIRSVDMQRQIIVEGYQWASARYWTTYNANLNIVDPARRLTYEAHSYFDSDGSGRYLQSYAEQRANPNTGVQTIQPFLQWLSQKGVRGYLGEFGVPKNDPNWLTVLNNFLAALRSANVPGTMWEYVYTMNSWWPASVNDPLMIVNNGNSLNVDSRLKSVSNINQHRR